MITVLVAYASKHNSTAEIAEEIGAVLKLDDRINVDVRSVDTVEHITLYDAVIIGSAVYMGQWQTPAAAFLEQHTDELSDRPVWLFSSGPTGQGNPHDLMKGWNFPVGLQAFADQIKPRDIALFHGKLNPEKLNFFERSTIKMIGAPVGDFRNWDVIHEWAATIAETLLQEQPQPVK